MTQKKPACSEFLIASVKKLRKDPANIKSGTAAGVQLKKVFAIAFELYSVDEIRSTIETLLKSGELVLTARVVSKAKDEGGKIESGSTRTQQLKVLPVSPVLREGHWILDDDLKSVDPKMVSKYHLYWGIKLYITADGLPRVACEAEKFNNRYRTLADKVVQEIWDRS